MKDCWYFIITIFFYSLACCWLLRLSHSHWTGHKCVDTQQKRWQWMCHTKRWFNVNSNNINGKYFRKWRTNCFTIDRWWQSIKKGIPSFFIIFLSFFKQNLYYLFLNGVFFVWHLFLPNEWNWCKNNWISSMENCFDAKYRLFSPPSRFGCWFDCLGQWDNDQINFIKNRFFFAAFGWWNETVAIVTRWRFISPIDNSNTAGYVKITCWH